jgi:uncharacterized membrane protein YsdA (DUF1294 family)
MNYLIGYFLVINLISMIVMRIDKNKAKKHEWRISENMLFMLALCMGSIGIWAGMYLFKHKTKHYKFVFGIPVIIILQAIAFYLIFKNII